MMSNKPLDLPLEVAKVFVSDMRAFFAAGGTGPEADAIAARQLHILRDYQGPRDKPIKLHQVKELFRAMKDEL